MNHQGKERLIKNICKTRLLDINTLNDNYLYELDNPKSANSEQFYMYIEEYLEEELSEDFDDSFIREVKYYLINN